MKRFFKMYLNSVRRFVVNHLLGKSLTVQKINTPSSYKYRLIDMKRRIPYADWEIVKAGNNIIRLSRLPASRP